MFHAIATLIFALVAVRYISYETGRKVSMSKDWLWLAMAVALPLIASAIDKAVGGTLGNFLLHSIGGGMSSAFLFFYLSNLFQLNINWRLQAIMLFAFVSCLGIFNELLEYAIELTTSLVMSLDSQDTWRDFVANTTGAFIIWLLVRAPQALGISKKQG